MNSYLSDKTILSSPTSYRRMTVIPSSRVGYSLWTFADGTVLSIQPDGTEQTRPKGTDGGFEQSLVIGNRTVYDYDGMEVSPIMYDCVVNS